MLNEFVQVTDKRSNERYFVNLEDISFIRENKSDDSTVLGMKSKEKLFFSVHESFNSFEEFFEENKEGE